GSRGEGHRGSHWRAGIFATACGVPKCGDCEHSRDCGISRSKRGCAGPKPIDGKCGVPKCGDCEHSRDCGISRSKRGYAGPKPIDGECGVPKCGDCEHSRDCGISRSKRGCAGPKPIDHECGDRFELAPGCIVRCPAASNN